METAQEYVFISPGARMIPVYDTKAANCPINLSLNADLISRARVEGLNLSALAEQAVADALSQCARDRLAAEIAQGCRAHEQYLAEYGSLGDAIRAERALGE